MSELENLLLEAAGRTGESTSMNQSHAHSRWRQEGSATEPKKSDSDNHSGSRIPPNRSLRGPQEKDEMRRSWVNGNHSRFSRDKSDGCPSNGSDFHVNAAEKEDNSKIPELGRKTILASRDPIIDDNRMKKRTRDSFSESEKYRDHENPPPYPSRGRSSVRIEKPTAKADALNRLCAKKMRQREPDSLIQRSGDSAAVSISSSRTKDFDSLPELDSSESEDGFHTDFDDDDNLDDFQASKSRPITYEDAKEITIRRSKLAKLFMEPFFEQIVAGCFVRIGIGSTCTGPKYRLCVVKNVDSTDQNRRYKLEGRTTCKWLNCIWGSEASAARWQMAMVSESPPTEKEFNEWLNEMERNGRDIPCRQDVKDKMEKIQNASTYVYSADTVKEIVKQKKLVSSRPINYAVEKVLLKNEIATAESLGKEAEAERLRAKLKDMEKLSKEVKLGEERAVKLLEMNRRNRVENYKNASKAKPVDTSLKAGDPSYDPFSRRWTRSTCAVIVRSPKKKGGGETTNDGDGQENDTEAGEDDTKGGEDDTKAGEHDTKDGEAAEVATVEAMEKAEGEGELVDTTAPVDYDAELRSLHNFDLPISSTALNRFGEPDGVKGELMARKRKIEASTELKIPDCYGRSSRAVTLSINDYKRRRNLLL